MKNYIWIIETLWFDGSWRPSVSAATTREAARLEMKEWKLDEPDLPMRIRKYIRET